MKNKGNGKSTHKHTREKKKRSKNKNIHAKAYYLTYGLKISNRKMVQMHSQSKQTTTKHIQMRTCILSYNSLDLLERIARATILCADMHVHTVQMHSFEAQEKPTSQGNKNQCSLEITSNDGTNVKNKRANNSTEAANQLSSRLNAKRTSVTARAQKQQGEKDVRREKNNIR